MEPKIVLLSKHESSVVNGGGGSGEEVKEPTSTHNNNKMAENSVKEEEEEDEIMEVPKAKGLMEILTPFVKKTYEMVDDPQTDEIVSWGYSSDSFVIWDPFKFSSVLLPLFFKHSNFSSFIRQLNTYGFRKVQVDRWEFANSGFKKGKKHLLKTIKRKNHGANKNVKMLLRREGEVVETLKKEQEALKVEILDMKQQQQNSDTCLGAIGERLESVEWNQREFVMLIAKAMKRTHELQKKALENANQCDNNKEKSNLLTCSKPSNQELLSGNYVMEEDDLISIGEDETEEALLGVDQTYKLVHELEDLIAKPPSSFVHFANVGEITACPTNRTVEHLNADSGQARKQITF